ncbi:hypothetical protein CO657_02830 [Rhizobium acidisoli]|uniref:Uncharacterized protein n=1 Tax=Rhizobium acidisoli TaxID=1538158 RepID=A0AAE5TU49_9HYPH|nr:hypothetical protein CO657_02830 [Rhizobium acidisoli]
MLKAVLKSPGSRPAKKQMPTDVANATDIYAGRLTSLRNGSLRHVAIDDNCCIVGRCDRPGRAACILSSISKPMSHYNRAAASPDD